MTDVQKPSKIDKIRTSIECDIEDIDTVLEVIEKSLYENDDMYTVMDKLEAYRTGLQTSLAHVSGGVK
jgi:hypothetical protein